MPILTDEEKKLELYEYLCKELEKGSLSKKELYKFTKALEINNADLTQTIDEVLKDNKQAKNRTSLELKSSYEKLEQIRKRRILPAKKTPQFKSAPSEKLGKKENRPEQNFDVYKQPGIYRYDGNEVKRSGRGILTKSKKKISSKKSREIINQVISTGKDQDLDPRKLEENPKDFKVNFNNTDLAATRATIIEHSNQTETPNLHGTQSYSEPGGNNSTKIGFLNKASFALLNTMNDQIKTGSLNIKEIQTQIEDNSISKDDALKVIYIIEANNVDKKGKISLSKDNIKKLQELKLPDPKERELYDFISKRISKKNPTKYKTIAKIEELGLTQQQVSNVIYIVESDHYNGKKGHSITKESSKILNDLSTKTYQTSASKEQKTIEAAEVLAKLKEDSNDILKKRGNLADVIRKKLSAKKTKEKAKSSKLAKVAKFLTFGTRATDSNLADKIIANYKKQQDLTAEISSGKIFTNVKNHKNNGKTR